MGRRGPKSSASLSVIGADGVSAIRRPEPPAHLGEDAVELWRNTVNAKPADWWAGGLPVLEAYCCLSISLRRTLIALEKQERESEFIIEDWRNLQRQAAELAGRVSMLAGKSRLTPQSQMHPRTAGRNSGHDGPKPWEYP